MSYDYLITRNIREDLKQPLVAERIRERLKAALEKLTISIGSIAELIDGVSEVQLRNWEKAGILSPVRALRNNKSTDNHPGQRRYRLDELTKVIATDELRNGPYSLKDIAAFMEQERALLEAFFAGAAATEQMAEPAALESVEEQVRQKEQALFWDFFLPRIIYQVLCLLFESPINVDVRLFLPIRKPGAAVEAAPITNPEDLPRLGEVMLGQLERDRAFSIILAKRAVLETPELYHLMPLADLIPSDEDHQPVDGYLAINKNFVDIIKPFDPLREGSKNARRAAGRILQYCQEHSSLWSAALQERSGALVYHAPHFVNPTLGNPFLKQMAEVVVQMGGLNPRTGEPSWRFCCILGPQNFSAPLLQSSLVVEGQSKAAPHRVGETVVTPSHKHGLSILAFQSGTMLYPSNISIEAPYPSIAWSEREGPVRSAVAVPVEKLGKWLGGFYVVSDEPDAFSDESLQLLRSLGEVLGEWMISYRSREISIEELDELIARPASVDLLLKEFLTANDFMRDLENMLWEVAEGDKRPFEQYLSFIIVDIDNLSGVARERGDQAAKNLTLAVGRRINDQINRLFSRPKDATLYRAYTDRFYLLLKNVSYEQAKDHADGLKRALNEEGYRIDLWRMSLREQTRPDDMLKLSLTTRLGVTGYNYEQLKMFLFAPDQVPVLRDRLVRTLDDALSLGKDAQGQVVKELNMNLAPYEENIAALQTLLSSYTRESHPFDWAHIRLQLARWLTWLAASIDGDKEKQCSALSDAQQWIGEALQVFGEHRAYQTQHKEAIELQREIHQRSQSSRCKEERVAEHDHEQDG